MEESDDKNLEKMDKVSGFDVIPEILVGSLVFISNCFFNFWNGWFINIELV